MSARWFLTGKPKDGESDVAENGEPEQGQSADAPLPIQSSGPRIRLQFDTSTLRAAIEEQMVRQASLSGFFASHYIVGPGSIDFGFAASRIDSAKLELLKAAEPQRVTKRQPDYVHVLTGWRAWDVKVKNKGLRLEALGGDYVWKPKQQVAAKCRAFGSGRGHIAPAFNCTCGFWAFKSQELLVEALKREHGSEVRVIGSASLWGRVVETENGYRAQYAYPSELWLFDRELEELGMVYDVPVRCVD